MGRRTGDPNRYCYDSRAFRRGRLALPAYSSAPVHTATSIVIHAPREKSSPWSAISRAGRSCFRTTATSGAGAGRRAGDRENGLHALRHSDCVDFGIRRGPGDARTALPASARVDERHEVVWTLTPTRDGTRVEIVHDLHFRVPLLAWLAEPIISGFFIENVASKRSRPSKSTSKNRRHVIEAASRRHHRPRADHLHRRRQGGFWKSIRAGRSGIGAHHQLRHERTEGALRRRNSRLGPDGLLPAAPAEAARSLRAICRRERAAGAGGRRPAVVARGAARIASESASARRSAASPTRKSEHMLFLKKGRARRESYARAASLRRQRPLEYRHRMRLPRPRARRTRTPARAASSPWANRCATSATAWPM